MAQYLAVKLAQALHDQALTIVQLMNANGWSVEQIYNLDQSNRIWRTHTANLFAVQRWLMDALGFSPEKSKNILIQQTPIVEQDVDALRRGAAAFLELHYDQDLIRVVAERNIFALGREPEQIKSWQQTIEADNLNPLDNLKLLTRRKNILFPDSKPRAIPPNQYAFDADPPPLELTEQLTADSTQPAPAQTSFLDLPESALDAVRENHPELDEQSETVPQALWEAAAQAEKPPVMVTPTIPKAPALPKVIPSNPPAYVRQPEPDSVRDYLEPHSPPTVRQKPVAQDPPAEDWVDDSWDKHVQTIIENALPKGGTKAWTDFQKANDWLAQRESIQTKNLQLLSEWFALPKVIDRPNTSILFFAGILLGKDLIRETSPDPKKRLKPADWEKRLPEILELPTHILWFRLYVARRLLEVSPVDYPRVLLMRWEKVSGAQDEYSPVRPLSLPPPAPENEQPMDEARLRAVAAELRYRRNEVESRNIKLPAGRRTKPGKLSQRRKRIICILASKHRARFLERLGPVEELPLSTRFPTRDDARWLMSRSAKPKP